MTYVTATAEQFQGSFEFTAFAEVSDGHVEQALEQAEQAVSHSCLSEDDYQRGQMLYAAHLLTIAGLGSGAAAELAKSGLDDFSSVRSGGLSVTRNSDQTDTDPLMSTRYGRLYLELGRQSVFGIQVANA